MSRNLVLNNFTEPPLNFLPTYKLDIDSDVYDSGPKKRIPAWTDRVLYVRKPGFECTAYDSDVGLRTSDHRPVFASFSSVIHLCDGDRNCNRGDRSGRGDSSNRGDISNRGDMNGNDGNGDNGNRNDNTDENDEHSSRNNSFKERSHPEFSSESQVCSLM